MPDKILEVLTALKSALAAKDGQTINTRLRDRKLLIKIDHERVFAFCTTVHLFSVKVRGVMQYINLSEGDEKL